MKAKKIKVVKNWPELKLVCNIQVFLGFTNFYWRFIQGFNKIVASFISILKLTGLSDKLVSNRKNGSKSAFSRNNNSRSSSWKNNDK